MNEDQKKQQHVMDFKDIALDPVWGWGVIQFDQTAIATITLFHPRHGPITVLMPQANLIGLTAGLDEMKKSLGLSEGQVKN